MHAPTDEQRAVIEARSRPCWSSPAPGPARPRRWPPRGLARRQRPRRARPGPRSHLHPQGCHRARRAHQRDRLRRLQRAGLWTPSDDDDAARPWAAPPPSPPTTRMPVAWSASTRCGWARVGVPAALRGGGLAVRRRGRARLRRRRWTPSPTPRRPSPPPWSTSPGRWPSTCSTTEDVARVPRPRRRRAGRAARGGQPRQGPAQGDQGPRRAAQAAASCPWSSATSPSSASATRWTSPTRWRSPPGSRPGSRTSGRSSASGSGPCCSTSSRDTSEAQLELLRALFVAPASRCR